VTLQPNFFAEKVELRDPSEIKHFREKKTLPRHRCLGTMSGLIEARRKTQDNCEGQRAAENVRLAAS
jgi:hypothetical protein